jgi:predicted dehydrogenase
MAALGRRIRLGLIGGGSGALIGPVHRIAARLDDRFEILAGVLSSDPAKSLEQGRALGLRAYDTVPAMLASEKGRADAIDAVAIVTPNDSHAEFATLALDAGLDVICDKPITNTLESGVALAKKARAKARVFVLTHNYSGYPMVREARAAIAAGEIGPLRFAHVTYLQGSLGPRVEDDPAAIPPRLRWRLDPAKGGESHVMGDIGTHAHQLLTFVTGKRVASVLADVGAAMPGRTTHDTATAILKLEDGTKGLLLATKVATGAQNVLTIEAYGEKGGISWNQAEANDLKILRLSQPTEIRTRGLPTLSAHAKRATRIPVGHPEAFFEAFANVYADFADLVAARITGSTPDPLALLTPDAATGVDGLAFIDACLASTASGTWADVPKPL